MNWRKNYFINGFHILLSALCLANIIVICRFWSQMGTIVSRAIVENSSLADVITVFSFQNSLLQTFLMVFALIIAILGIWGYQNIKASAIEEAKKTVDDYLKKRTEATIKAEKAQQESLSSLDSTLPQKDENDEPY